MRRRTFCALAAVSLSAGCLRQQDVSETESQPEPNESTESEPVRETTDEQQESDEPQTNDEKEPTDTEEDEQQEPEMEFQLERTWTLPDRGHSIEMADSIYIASQSTSGTGDDGERFTVGGVASITSDGEVQWRKYNDVTAQEAPIRRYENALYVGQSGGGPSEPSLYSAEDDAVSRLFAVSTDGDEQWTVESDHPVVALASPTERTVVMAAGRLGDGENFSIVRAIERETGETRWQKRIPGFLENIVVDDGTVYANGANYLYAHEVETGDQQWQKRGGWRQIASDSGTLYAPNHEGLQALAGTDGTEKWQAETFDNVTTVPRVDGGTVYVGSRDTGVYAFDAETGQQQWRYQADSPIVSLKLARGEIWAVSDDDTVIALSDDGTPVLREEIDGNLSANTHAVTDESVIVTGVYRTLGFEIRPNEE